MIGGPTIGEWHFDDEDGDRVRYDAMGVPVATVYRSAYEERGAGWYRRPHLPPVMVDEVDIPTAMAVCDRGLAEWAELTAPEPAAERGDEQALIDAHAAGGGAGRGRGRADAGDRDPARHGRRRQRGQERRSEVTDRYDLEILPVCLGLHMAHTGSADPLPSEDKARHVAWLRQRLADWQPTPHAKWERFDETVKTLIMATLDEVDPMPLDVLTPEEQDLVIAAIPLQAGLTRDGERMMSASGSATLTAEEEREAYRFGKVTGIGLDAGKRAIAESKTRRETMTREEAEAKLRALGQSSDMAAALVRNARAVLSQGHTIGLTAESAPKLHAVLSAYVGAK